MSAVLFCFERASAFGLAVLALALGAQWLLDGRAPASWRVWLWRVALLQTTLALLPLSPVALAVLPPSPARGGRPLSSDFSPTSSDGPQLSSDASQTKLGKPQLSSDQEETKKGSPQLSSDQEETRKGSYLIPSDKDGTKKGSYLTASDQEETKLGKPQLSSDKDGFSFHKLLFEQVAWPLVALGLYCLGLAVQFAALARAFWRVRRTLRACSPMEDAQIQTELRALAEKMGVQRVPRTLLIEDGAPFLVGVFRPSIVLPRSLLNAGSRELEAVLSHELAHQKRRDLAWNALLWAMGLLFWFHPLAWMARRFLALEVESACDEMVLSSTRIAPRSYAALLLATMNTQPTPLTAGVADGFGTLKTRLLRLNRAPKRPHLSARIAFFAALCLAFGALVPLRFVARAQMAAPVSKAGTVVSKAGAVVSKAATVVTGTVVDEREKPVAGATVYAMRWMAHGPEPIEITVSDPRGAFRFSPKVREEFEVSLFVDAGTRGMGEGLKISPDGRATESANVHLTHVVQARFLFLDSKGRPVPNLRVYLGRIGVRANWWMAMPSSIRARMKATTNARGVAVFPPLPSGKQAEFVLPSEFVKNTIFVLDDVRGGQFLPLSIEGSLLLGISATSKTIRLVVPITIQGRVSLPGGGAAKNVLVMARRVDAQEEGNSVVGSNGPIAQTRTDASGTYVLAGLRPGKYYVWIYPEERLTRSYTGPSVQKIFLSPTNTQDFTLSRGALIQGVVLAQSTGKPVRGQTMGLFDSQGSPQYTTTDARGFFQFRALGGKQRLWVHANGTNSPPPGFVLPAKSQFDFSIKDGQKREFVIKMPGEPVVKPTTGTVVGPDGKAVAGATVLYRIAGARSDSFLHSTKADANGKFSLPAKWSAVPVQLFADAGELTTPHSTIALPGETPTLGLEAGAWASVRGRVVDENKHPLAGANVQLYTVIGGVGTSADVLQSDADGRFHAEHLRPNLGVWVQCHLAGFRDTGGLPQTLKSGQHLVVNLSMRSAAVKVSGCVIGEDGKPAARFGISADGFDGEVLTHADGRFFLPQTSLYNGNITMSVYAPNNGLIWGNFRVRGSEPNGVVQNVVIHLSKAKRVERNSRRYAQPNPTVSAALIGKPAPEIRASRWKNGKPQPLSSLRGKVVLLNFGYFGWNPNYEVEDFARSFAMRVEVVGVQIDIPYFPDTQNEAPFPVAIDAPLPVGKGASLSGQTGLLYGNAQYVVIGRDGRVIYAGDALDRAISFAAAALR